MEMQADDNVENSAKHEYPFGMLKIRLSRKK